MGNHRGRDAHLLDPVESLDVRDEGSFPLQHTTPSARHVRHEPEPPHHVMAVREQVLWPPQHSAAQRKRADPGSGKQLRQGRHQQNP